MVKSKKGFTLIEILLVVLMIIVVAGLALPNFSILFERIQLDETAKNIVYLMRYVQNRAMIKERQHELVFDENNHEYWLNEISSDDEGGMAQSAPVAGRFGRHFSFSPRLTIETDNPEIKFYPDGKIDKVHLYICNRKSCLTVSTREHLGYVELFEGKVE